MPGTWAPLASAPPEDIRCGVCQKTFKRKDFLRQHMRMHAPERDVCRCPRAGCGRTYTTAFNLQSHILSFHEQQRPFVCEHAGCGKTFAMKVSPATLGSASFLPGSREMMGGDGGWRAGVWPITLAPAGAVLHQAGQTPDGPLPPEVLPSAWLEPAGSARPGPALDPLTQKSGRRVHSFVF